MAALRKIGGSAAIVEHWNSFARIRQDLFGWIDIVHCLPILRDGVTHLPGGVLGIQCTAAPHGPERLRKARGNKRLLDWLRSGNRLEVWEWKKRGPRGERKKWEVVKVPVREEDVIEAPLTQSAAAPPG